jgi:NTE family protein
LSDGIIPSVLEIRLEMNLQDIKIADAVFEGGGVKGIGLVGAVAVAEERGYQWESVAGTSAGAIVASLLAAGYTAVELKAVLDELDYTRFKDKSLIDNIPLAGQLVSLIFEKGIYEGDYFINWIRSLLKEKGVNTFGDLLLPEYENDKDFRFKLRVIASDLSRHSMLVLPGDIEQYGVNPEDLDVALAVRMSMSLPFFYEPVKIKNMTTNRDSYIVDGGVLSNFPVWLFDTPGVTTSWPTFGFKLVEPETEGGYWNIKGPISLLTALFSTMMEAHDARYIKNMNFARTIAIPTLGIGTAEFDLSKERSEALYQSGRQAAEKFFDTYDHDTFVRRFLVGVPTIGRGDSLRTGED